VVVSCQKCRTRFQLDEARIPAKGVRVRCSKCKHAFFVAPPASHDDTIHGLAREAAAQGRPSKPHIEASVDLPPVSSGGEPEDDWEFNIDPPGGASAGSPRSREDFDDRTPPPAEITDSEPTEQESVESFFELDGLSDPGPERGNEAPARPAAPSAAPAAAARTSSPPAKERKKAPPPIAPEQEVDFQDLGNPETWDFGVPEKPRPAEKAPKTSRKAARAAAEEPPAAVHPPSEAPRVPASALGALAGGAGWLLAIALFGFGLYGTLAAGRARQPELPPIQVGSLELADVRVRHIENLHAGPLVVVTGELRNPGAAPVQGTAARVRVTGARGEVLDAQPAWLGVLLSPAELRQADPAALARGQARSARVLAERSFEPQDRISVSAVLADLPPAAAAFRIEPGALSDLPDPEHPVAPPSEPGPAPSDPSQAPGAP
jgi:predicted Zn finger-like uncharacterized protein